MRYIRPLDALLPRTRQGILAAVLVRADKAWYVSELARRMKVPPSSLQRELRDLTDAGILKTHRQGRMAFYQANAQSPLFPELRGLLLKTVGLVDVLADALKLLAKKINVAFIYGSVANATENSGSDIDLMVVGTLTPMELSLPLRKARDLLGREINPTVYSAAEFEKKRLSKDHFLTHVLDKPKLFVLGNGNDLGEAPG
ncbi:MAG TPA: helix-turn-helix domain-containing protein [Bryobacteraceae bacterium]|nr:helix-turn-helix domain-containing protein [Bryobacteraceae bacterium]